MSTFVYLVHEQGGHDLLERFGLTDRFEADRPPTVHVIPPGGEPNGRGGTAFSTARRLPERLRWCGWPGQDALTVGFDPDDPPGPRSLQRRTVSVRGCFLRLGDGRRWLIPLVAGSVRRPESERCGLPTEPRLIGGELRDVVAERHAQLVEQIPTIQRLLGDWPAKSAETLPYCAALLSVGYRIGLAEVLALKLFDADSQAAALALAIDLYGRLGDKAVELELPQTG